MQQDSVPADGAGRSGPCFRSAQIARLLLALALMVLAQGLSAPAGSAHTAR